MPREYHWWIATSMDGKPQLVYGAPDRGSAGGEDAARSKAFEMLGGIPFTTHRYPTRTIQEASAYHRGKRLDRGDGLRSATQRLGHERSVNRLKERIAKRRAMR